MLTSVVACQHVVMIGDHKQLRPKNEHYPLTVEARRGFALNRSLFERLVLTGFPVEQLQVQHRMHPSIARIVSELTYDGKLQNSAKVAKYPSLRGARAGDTLLFINHEFAEDGEAAEKSSGNLAMRSATQSKCNVREAEYTACVVRYLLLQNYRSDQIVGKESFLSFFFFFFHFNAFARLQHFYTL